MARSRTGIFLYLICKVMLHNVDTSIKNQAYHTNYHFGSVYKLSLYKNPVSIILILDVSLKINNNNNNIKQYYPYTFTSQYNIQCT